MARIYGFTQALPALDGDEKLFYNKRAMGVTGVDPDDSISGGGPRCRRPRKKRQTNKREHSSVRARGL